jgi:anaerobic carbon-monoxide dehydrogenase iron sulfur subunit
MSVQGLTIIPSKCRGCRSCQLACSYSRHKVFNPAKSVIIMDREVETDHTTPVILSISCNLCGGNPACLLACPYEAIVANTDYAGIKIQVQV